MNLLYVNENPLPEGKQIGFPSVHPSHRAHMHGWLFETHERVFSALINKNTKIIFELGSWFGASTKWLAEHTSEDTVIFAIDLWDDSFILNDNHYNKSSELGKLLRNHPLYPTFLANLWEHRDKVVPLRMHTVEGLQLLKDRGMMYLLLLCHFHIYLAHCIACMLSLFGIKRERSNMLQ
jgi:hypothetical protein